ncbi:hydrolase 76 protein [Rhizina undulata]
MKLSSTLSPTGAMLGRLGTSLLLGSSLLAGLGRAQIPLNIDDQQSIKDAAKITATKLRSLYPTNESWFNPGEFGLIGGVQANGYYWWEGGAAMGSWIDYWHYTGDTEFNDVVTQALLHQVGPKVNFEPPNQTLSLGNDDQAFWGIAALSAAERGYPDPPADQPQWLALAQAVFNRQAERWDTADCNGGLRWQVFQQNTGYDYKNSISNGLLFNIGARLARYTGNQTYADWAKTVYTWTLESGLIDNKTYAIYDGMHIPECVVSSNIRWSYNAGVYLSGAAFMYNITQDAYWKNETTKLMNALDPTFFSTTVPMVMQESACEFDYQGRGPTCNTDQRSFKAYLARFMALTAVVAPFTQDYIMPRLRASAVQAAKSCNGGTDGETCGLSWISGTYDGAPFGIAVGGVGEHMAVMETIQSNLVLQSDAPLTQITGGTSIGNPAAGTDSSDSVVTTLEKTTTGDKAGAGILTGLVLGGLLGLTYWLLKP